MLTVVAPSLWSHERELRLPGGVVLPVRSTIVRLGSGRLWVCSPAALGPELEAELSRLGEVAHLVAPNLMHHLWLGEWSARFGRARVQAPPGLERKRPELRIDAPASDASAWEGEIEALPVEGAPKLEEVAFLHRPTRTLIVADLLFNVRRPRGLATTLVLGLMGTLGRLAKSRAWSMYVRDRRAHDASIARLVSRAIDRVLPCHGDVVNDDARPALLAALGVSEVNATAAA